MNVTTVSTGTTTHSTATLNTKTYKIEMLDDGQLSLASDDDDDDLISSDCSIYDGDLVQMQAQDDVANQLAAAGPVGVAAAAAIASSKKRKRPHSFETNPSVRKRQQNRLLRKLRTVIYEFTGRVGKQAVVLVATPGKPNTSYKVFGAKPLEDVMRNLKNIVMDELDNALAQQAPPPPQEDPTLFELPPLIIDGIPTPVEKMTQAQLRAFIPLMLKYSTGRGKPGWGRESTRPPWWPKELPWANVRMDARSEDDKQKISWTHALRKIVINCYKYHGREDLLPTFADEEDKVAQLISQTGEDDDEDEDSNSPSTVQTIQAVQSIANASTNTTNQQVNVVKINSAGTVITTHSNQLANRVSAPTIIQSTNNQHITTTATLPASTKIEILQAPQVSVASQQTHTASAQTIANTQVCIDPMTLADVDYTTQTVLSTIQNADGTVSLIQVDPNNPIITLPDGTTAQVQGVATLHQGEGGATIQTVQSLSDVNGHENMTVDLTEATVAQDGQIYITTEDGQGYPVSVSNMITVPVSASMYQSMMANIQQIHTNGDGTVCITPMQVDSHSNNNNNSNGNANNNINNNNGHYQCYSIMAAPSPGVRQLNSTRNVSLAAVQAHMGVANGSSSSSNSCSSSNSNNNNNTRCQIFNEASLSNNSSQQSHQQQNQNATTKFYVASNLHVNQANLNLNVNHTNNNNNNNNNNSSLMVGIGSSSNYNNISSKSSGKRAVAATMVLAAGRAANTPPNAATVSKSLESAAAIASLSVAANVRSNHKRRKQTLAPKTESIKLEDSGQQQLNVGGGGGGSAAAVLPTKVIKLEEVEN